ncbi:hypothetical protein LZ198_05245 [Myxococcus sp. K15C18031901]|uniref:AMIN-like domain-containing (lipo)protein n=1 Tax=Myxococcus dinghuensis TaxID=2906761 RepID=UPI0020A6FDEE|nr:hypothetical protein [Myxococcus dinghuensis]MCP3098282.1 hypothetical protein [Myxococcus dinghuensis]
MERAGRWVSSLWLAGCLLGGTGCSKKEEPPAQPAADLPQSDDLPDLPSHPPEGALPREGEAAAKPPVHVVVPPGSTVPVAAAKPVDEEETPPSVEDTLEAPAPPTPPAAGGGTVAEDPRNREWTSGKVRLKRMGAAQATLRSVRAGEHAEFDRVVFEFEGTQLPGYQLEYVKEATQCGSGNPVAVAGKAQLQVSFTPAKAHTDAGQPTVATRELKPALPVLQELERTCDFEGEVTWVLGTTAPHKYRVMELREPSRLVVDVQR